jgi:peptide/nickel transport system substrate-binding protein/oligopeptide transport system substrate-binding protein
MSLQAQDDLRVVALPICWATPSPMVGKTRATATISLNLQEKNCMRLGFRKLSVGGLVVVIGTLAMLLSGCGSSSSTQGNVLPPDKQIFKPQEIGPANGDLETIDPALVEFGVDYDKAQMIFPMLITIGDDGKPHDWAAASHEVSGDGLTYTFHLRPNLKWSDGTPITASDFAYSINRSEDPCTASPVSNYLDPVVGATDLYSENCPAGATHVSDTLIGKSVIASDPQTLQIKLNQPTGFFLGAFSYSTTWAVPKKLIDQYQDKWIEHLADGSGFGGNQFKLTKWDHSGHLEFTANDQFWGDASMKPILQHINYTLYKSVDTAWADYKAGTGDNSPSIPSAELDIAKGLKNSNFIDTPLLSVSWIVPNYHIAPFDDKRARNAFSLAMDRKGVSHTVYKDSNDPTIHMVIKGLPGYNPNLKNAAGDTGDATNSPNIAKAQELAKAYAADKCQGDYAKCAPVVITIATSGGQTAQLAAQARQQLWQQTFPGWNITINAIARGQQIKQAHTLQFTTGGWLADYPEPQDFLTLLWTKTAPYNGGFADVPAADALLVKADATLDDATRLPLYQQAEQAFVDDGAFIATVQNKNQATKRSYVRDWHVNPSQAVALTTWEKVAITG